MPTDPNDPLDGDAFDRRCMRRALELAARGLGHVEPNPLVGCVVVHQGRVVGEGWHGRFGGPHAEVEALREAGDQARGGTAYVTLEPCCHHGKTPPCTDALLAAGVRRVVVAAGDPFPAVAGRGLQRLRQAGLEVRVGVLEQDALELTAPFRKLVTRGRPWVHAKWAMTLDGKIATASGHSQWISNETSRHLVHQLRGRVDAVLVGRGTAVADDPRLTARPPGPRLATRIVLDTQARLPLASQLVRTAREVPVLLAVGVEADPERCAALQDAGCEVLRCPGATQADRWHSLLDELGRRRMTHVLVEGGREVLGSLFDAGEIDEVHVFLAPCLIGGRDAFSPLAGQGVVRIQEGPRLAGIEVQQLDGDIYVRGRIAGRLPDGRPDPLPGP